MTIHPAEDLVTLDLETPVWSRVFTVSPLVLVGTKEESGGYDLAPKHLAMPLGWDNYFGFVCTPRHATYRNARREGVFTVSYPRPTQVVTTSLAASAREGGESGTKRVVEALPTFPAVAVDGILLQDGYLHLECELHRTVDGFGGDAELVIGRIVAARAPLDAIRTTETADHSRLHAAPLLAYVDPGRFAEIRETHAFPFPAGFLR